MQLLEKSNIEEIEKIYITASGGALRDFSKEQMEKASIKEALNHPVWKMGKKVTIDSATMVNKGLELMEAYWLFPIEPHQLGVVVHPKVAVHAFADFKDGSGLSQLAVSDMIIPISSALSYPKKLPLKSRISNLQFNYFSGELDFLKPDFDKYPLLKLAFEILEKKDYSAMVAYAISDEIAVENFLEGKITIGQINSIVSKTVKHFSNIIHPETIEEISELLITIENYSKKLVKNEKI
jgi:1-deoxy-D-xylulose-5-phosphate reductoisomerase